MSNPSIPCKTCLITGGSGYIGSLLIQHLSKQPQRPQNIISLDIREYPEKLRSPGVTYLLGDVGSPLIKEVIAEYQPEVVVHLAAIVMPARPVPRELMYRIDVEGTKWVLEACLEQGARRFITTSSGAAYGYYADNPDWLTEEDPIRGNYEFAYAYHKRLVEEMLATYRQQHPELEQTIFRIGSILGANTQNQITTLFEKKNIMGLSGTDSPFVIIWDEDLVRLLALSIRSEKTGIYNVAGDGALSLEEIAALQGKKVMRIPTGLVKATLAIAKPLGLAPYGPEQVGFLQYRPVLANRKLKEEFGFIPEKSSKEAFLYYLAHRDQRTNARPQLKPEDLGS